MKWSGFQLKEDMCLDIGRDSDFSKVETIFLRKFLGKTLEATLF
jgi:hypothetical protein